MELTLLVGRNLGLLLCQAQQMETTHIFMFGYNRDMAVAPLAKVVIRFPSTMPTAQGLREPQAYRMSEAQINTPAPSYPEKYPMNPLNRLVALTFLC
jgi:hypothetical protein